MKLFSLTRSIFVTHLLLGIGTIEAHAEQLQFNKQKNKTSYTFSYQWKDLKDEHMSFSFAIDNKALFSRFRTFRTFKPELADKKIQQQIKRKLKKEPLKDVQVSFSRQDGQVLLKSPDPNALNLAQDTMNEWQIDIRNGYLKDNYYHLFTTHEGTSGIKPDHVSIALNSIDIFKPFRESIIEIVSIKDIRKVSNFILSFVQSIPYSTLESRATSSGAGYSVPTKVLWENQGDCDSKMALTAAMMRAVMPRIDLVFIYLDNHAMLGVGMEPKGDDKYINVDGNIYVLADPTGPRLMALGDVGFDSEQAINGNLYTVEAFKEDASIN